MRDGSRKSCGCYQLLYLGRQDGCSTVSAVATHPTMQCLHRHRPYLLIYPCLLRVRDTSCCICCHIPSKQQQHHSCWPFAHARVPCASPPAVSRLQRFCQMPHSLSITFCGKQQRYNALAVQWVSPAAPHLQSTRHAPQPSCSAWPQSWVLASSPCSHGQLQQADTHAQVQRGGCWLGVAAGERQGVCVGT
jgi:hypothetical protein